jgi:hypothetical protein
MMSLSFYTTVKRISNPALCLPRQEEKTCFGSELSFEPIELDVDAPVIQLRRDFEGDASTSVADLRKVAK